MLRLLMENLSIMLTRRLASTAIAASLVICLSGCRPQEASRFTPSAEVAALTADLDDADELKLFKKLQSQIAEILQRRCGSPQAAKSLKDGKADLATGAALYATYCVQCHGVNGDGQGTLAIHLNPMPRDYTQGIFKFTSTSNGKARRADLIHTVRRGIRGTSMPSFATLSDDELGSVIDYVISLAQRGELQRTLAAIAFEEGEIPSGEDLDGVIGELLVPWAEANHSVVSPATPMPAMTEESVAQGHELFLKLACSRCHGNDGRGGTKGVDVGIDAWGHKAAAADLSSGMLRGGNRPVDLYRRIYAGIPGSPMPGFANQFADDPDAVWRLVQYIEDTAERRRRKLPPLEDTAPAPATTAPAVTTTDAATEETTSDAASEVTSDAEAEDATSDAAAEETTETAPEESSEPAAEQPDDGQ